jgi:hypothetical protein
MLGKQLSPIFRIFPSRALPFEPIRALGGAPLKYRPHPWSQPPSSLAHQQADRHTLMRSDTNQISS